MDEYLDHFSEDHINGGYGDVLDRLAAEESEEYPDRDFDDDPWDHILAQQELEDFEQAGEYFGYDGGDEGW